MSPTKSASNHMHQYKVHLPKTGPWDEGDFNEWLGQSFSEGLNREQRDWQKNDFVPDTCAPISLDDLPIMIDGSETESFPVRCGNFAHQFKKFEDQ